MDTTGTKALWSNTLGLRSREKATEAGQRERRGLSPRTSWRRKIGQITSGLLGGPYNGTQAFPSKAMLSQGPIL